MIFLRWKKFNGQVFATYLIGYGVIRYFIEALRTDSLYIANTTIRVSQVVSLVAIAIGLIIYIYNLSALKDKFPIPTIKLPDKKCKEYNTGKLDKIYKDLSKEL